MNLYYFEYTLTQHPDSPHRVAQVLAHHKAEAVGKLQEYWKPFNCEVKNVKLTTVDSWPKVIRERPQDLPESRSYS